MQNRQTFGIVELADSKDFEKLLNFLEELFGLVVALRHPDGNLCKAYFPKCGESPLCEIILSCPEGLSKCLKTNTLFCNTAAQQKHGLIYNCHAGLVEFVMPIYVEGKHIATLNCGQILPSPPTKTGFKKLIENIHGIPVDEQKLKKAYFKSQYLEHNKVEIIFEMLSFFASYVCEVGRGLGSAHWNHKYPEIIEAREYIKRNFHNPITLQTVAENVGLSECHLSRLFVKATGINFTHFLNLVRLAEAKNLLEKTEWTITKIAFEVGYGSLPYFNYTFKKYEKCTPHEFRVNKKRG